MRQAPLRIALFAGVALIAAPAAAQTAPASSPPEVAPVSPEPAVVPEAEAAPAGPVAPAIPEIWAPAPVDTEGRSAYGLYLSGRAANQRGEREAAAILLAQTEALTPEQPEVRDEAFRTALFAGDLGVAARLAPQGDGAPALLADAGRLADVVETWSDGDAAAAWALLKDQPLAEPHTRAGAYLAPWLAAAVGDWTAALKPLDGAPTDPTSLFRRHQRALLLEMRGRYDEAEAEFKALVAVPVGAQLFRVSYGRFLERRGRKADALAQYAPGSAPGASDATAAAARARLEAGGSSPPLPSLRGGAADGLTVAALQAGAEGGQDLASIYLRMAQSLDPSDSTLLQLGETLAAARFESAARDAFSRVSQDSPEAYARARYAMGASFARDGDSDAALAAYSQAVQAGPNEPALLFAQAGQLFDLGRHAEALAVLNQPALNNDHQPFEVRYMRGAVLESLERYDEAENELWAALQLKPNDPNALNYLGYLWVDSGRRVTQGAEMIARAHAADPDNGNIQDSLGWAQYRQGQYADAVATLEEAVAKLPANPEIVDHLGDAYWQVGRRREAGWQWNRVLTLDADAGRRAEVEKKLTEGPADPTPVTAS